MRTGSMLPTVAALTFTITACQPRAASFSEENIAAVRATNEAFFRHILSGDWTAASALHTEDAVWMPPNKPSVQSRAAILAYMEAYPPVTDFRNRAAPMVDGSGDLAVVRSPCSITFSPPEAEPITDICKYVFVLRKQSVGAWLFTVQMWSSDLPFPEGE